MIYYEQMTPMGVWSPRTSPEAPVSVGAEGNRFKIRAVQEVPKDLEKLTLSQLYAVLSPDGHLRAAHRGGADARPQE